MKGAAKGSEDQGGRSQQGLGVGECDVEVIISVTTSIEWRLRGQRKALENSERILQNLTSIFGYRKMARCKDGKFFQREEFGVLINIIIKSPKPDLACIC